MAHSKQTCPDNTAVVGACTSGGLADCGEGRISHYVDCSTESLVDVPVETDWSDTGWIDVDFEFGFWGSHKSNKKKAWAHCPSGEAIFSRCAVGRYAECWLPNHSHHGIQCGKLSEIYEFTEDVPSKWVCKDHGANAKCPPNYVAVSSCGSSLNSDCQSDGCKHINEVFTGLQCKAYKLKPTTEAPTERPSAAPSKAPSIASCLENTSALLEATKADYDDTDVRTTKLTVDGQKKEVVDFAANAGENAVFEKTCKNAGGRYVELNYEAICKTPLKAVVVTVKRHPRCYATVCRPDDKQILFEDFTLRLTEERNDGDWECTGELKEEVQTGTGENPSRTRSGKSKEGDLTPKSEVQTGCEVETDLINDSKALIRESADVKQKVEDTKFLYIFTRKQQLVTFSNTEAFRDVCIEGGFKAVQLAQANIACGEAEFEVQDFSVCLGNSCRDEEQGYSDAIAALFQMKIAGYLKNPKAVCTITSDALSASRGFIAVGTMVFGLFWHLVL
jgi:hypothetical protein